MRLGVFADVHANLHALEVALHHLEREGAQQLVCLGDLVGYGPQPNEVVGRISDLGVPTVAGNHDLVAAGRAELNRCSSGARASLEWTIGELTPSTSGYLQDLPLRVDLEGGILAAHGSIDDPWRYVRRAKEAGGELSTAVDGGHTLLLLGHTHRQMVVTHGSSVATSEGVLARKHRVVPLGPPAFVNPGAVGQSRELRPLVRCALIDTSQRRIHLYALRYPHDRCKEELRLRDLPTGWCHPRPTIKKIARQALRDREDRRVDLPTSSPDSG